MVKLKRLWLPLVTVMLIGAVGFLVSCSLPSYGIKVTEEQKAKIIIGKTAKLEVLKELGDPDQRIDLGDGKEQFSYIHGKGTYKLLIPGKYKYTEFWIEFDKDGLVADFGERPTTKSPTLKSP